MAEAEPLRPVLDALAAADEELVAEPVEPRVARLRERGRQRHARVDAGLDVLERVAADRERAAAKLRRRRRDDPFGERGLRDDRLERRAGRIHALRRLVQQARIRAAVLVEAREVLRVVRGRDLVVRRVARERVHGAGPRVHDDGRRRHCASEWPFARASAMPSRTALSAARWIRASIVSCSVGSDLPVARAGAGRRRGPSSRRAGARGRSRRSGTCRTRLDAGDADRLARLVRARSAACASIAGLTSPSRPRNVLPNAPCG